jgi:predicted TIM-barrel fold metal-dependent hydrolase
MDMVHALLDAVPTSRLLWGTDLTIDTAVARLRYIEALGLSDGDLERIRWRNARALFAGVRTDGDH